MSSKIALRLAALALGAAFASAPALAQYQTAPQSPANGPNGAPGYGMYNEEPGMGAPGDQARRRLPLREILDGDIVRDVKTSPM